VKSEDSAARQPAVTEKHSHYTRPRSREYGHGLPLSNHVTQFSEKRVSWEHRVRTGHRVAACEETVVLAGGDKTVQKKTALSKGENDLSAPDIAYRAGRNLRHVARPQCRQHAFAANLQSQPAGPAQSFYR